MQDNSSIGVNKVYNKIKTQLSVLGIIIDLGLLIILAFSPLSKMFAGYIEFYVLNPYVQFLLFISVISVIFFLLSFPLDYFGSFVIEHEFGLSNQSGRKWLIEQGKSSLLGIVIGFPLLMLFYFFIRTTGYNWWIFFSIVLFLFSVLIAKLAPTLIFPIFYKFSPLNNEEISAKISALMDKHGISINGIFQFDMSKNTKKANAGFTGFGKSKRIILSDTLLSNFNAEEIEVIFAHELGHYMKKHIVKNIFMSAVIIFTSFYLCSRLFVITLSLMGFIYPYEIAALPILLLYLTIFSFIIMPITNTVSRFFEVEADTFALQTTGNKTAFVSSMEKLGQVNLADKEPNPIYEFIFYSHPSIEKRVKFAENFVE